jgi:hypothetical protein
MILVTVLLLMLIVTILGVMAIDVSTVDLQIAGNMKRSTTAFEGAEAGIDLSIPIIEATLAAGALTPDPVDAPISVDGQTVVLGADLGTEILSGSDATARNTWDEDIRIPSLGNVQVLVDIDRLYSDVNAGSAMEFASGYEGVGAGAAGGGMSVLFRISSQGTR